MPDLTGSIAILGALEAELEAFLARIEDQQVHDLAGIQVLSGQMHGKVVVLARLGVGKVNAAMVTALLLHHVRPAAVLCTGVAGALNPALHPGDIVIAAQTAQHDYGRALPEGFQMWPTWNRLTGEGNPAFFPANETLLRVAKAAGRQVKLNPVRLPDGERQPQITSGTIITGDAMIASSATRHLLHTTHQAEACEMEGAAVAQVCWQYDVPALVIRSISDRADENVLLDWTLHVPTAAANAAALVTAIIAALDTNHL